MRPLLLAVGVAMGANLRVEESPKDQSLETMSKMVLRCAIVGAPVDFIWTFTAEDQNEPKTLTTDTSINIKNVSFSRSNTKK